MHQSATYYAFQIVYVLSLLFHLFLLFYPKQYYFLKEILSVKTKIYIIPKYDLWKEYVNFVKIKQHTMISVRCYF